MTRIRIRNTDFFTVQDHQGILWLLLCSHFLNPPPPCSPVSWNSSIYSDFNWYVVVVLVQHIRHKVTSPGRPPQARTNPFERFVRPAANQRINYNHHHHPFCFCFRFLEIKVEKCCSKNLPPYFFSLHLSFGTSRKKVKHLYFFGSENQMLTFFSFFLSVCLILH